MVSSNPDDGQKKPVRSLRDLPQEISPPSDLWPAIEAHLPPRAPRARNWFAPRALAGVAAVVAALGIGIWIGRVVFPVWQAPQTVRATAQPSDMLRAAYVTDPRYLREREQLIQALQERL